MSEKRVLHVKTMQFGGILGQHFIKLLDKTVAFVSCGKRVISQKKHKKKKVRDLLHESVGTHIERDAVQASIHTVRIEPLTKCNSLIRMAYL